MPCRGFWKLKWIYCLSPKHCAIWQTVVGFLHGRKARLRLGDILSVLIVALTATDLYLSPGDTVPDNAAAYVKAADSEKDAWEWILSGIRPRYFAGGAEDADECVYHVVDTRGRVLS